MNIVDLRSDTVTKPTPEMRKAMAEAKVGDDVYGEDPTVNYLQELSARLLGMEAALFVPSGTMGNLAALLAHCDRGDEVILGDKAHTFVYEQGGMAALGGIMPHTIPNQPDGTFRWSDIQAAIRADDDHFPRSRLICLENTHNNCNGSPVPPEYIKQVVGIARVHDLKVHIDGARIFNAAVALKVPVSELVQGVDSVTFCLSKGLCAPVGSVLCGSSAFIAAAKRARKVLGGGMRQAGIIAAAGVVALESMVERLAEDHARAKRLAEGFANMRGIEVGPVSTNIFYFHLTGAVKLSAPEVSEALRPYGVLLGARDARSFRAVTHYWIDDAGIEQTLDAMQKVLRAA